MNAKTQELPALPTSIYRSMPNLNRSPKSRFVYRGCFGVGRLAKRPEQGAESRRNTPSNSKRIGRLL